MLGGWWAWGEMDERLVGERFVWSGELFWSGELVEVRGVGERGLGGWRGEIASAPAVPRNWGPRNYFKKIFLFQRYTQK